MLFASKELSTPAPILAGGGMKLRGYLIFKKTGAFATELEGDLQADATVHLLSEARLAGNITSGDGVVLHDGASAHGALESKFLEIQEGAHFSGPIRVGYDGPAKIP